MKALRNLFGLSALLAISLSAHAQSQFGLKAGFNLARVQYQHADFASIPAYHAGLFYRQQLTYHLHAQVDLLYSLKGTQEGLSLMSGQHDEPDFKLQLNYLTLPLALQYHLDNFFLEGGAELGWQVQTTVSGDEVDNVELTEAVWGKEFDLGLFAGLGYQIGRFQVSGRYNFGIIPLLDGIQTDENGDPVGEAKSGYNRTAQISLAYALFRS
ncbi:MAG: PorT family protein [Phaeodactylibacter sp.]|nr:PorT family protein [Phaeodactylibacter sp.]